MPLPRRVLSCAHGSCRCLGDPPGRGWAGAVHLGQGARGRGRAGDRRLRTARARGRGLRRGERPRRDRGRATGARGRLRRRRARSHAPGSQRPGDPGLAAPGLAEPAGDRAQRPRRDRGSRRRARRRCGGLSRQAVLDGGARGARARPAARGRPGVRQQPVRRGHRRRPAEPQGAPGRAGGVAVEHGVRAARLPPAPPRAGRHARADPELGMGLRARPRDQRRGRLCRLSAPQARQARRSRPDLHRACRGLPPGQRRLSGMAGARGPARRRLLPGGLRWRLAGWVTLVTLLCTGAAFVAVYRGTGTQLRHQTDQEIEGDAREFAHNLALARARTNTQLFQAASRYVRDQPFSASSTLLFALIPGRVPATNTPELFGHPPPDDGETPAQQRQENRISAQLISDGDGHTTLSLPDVGNLRLLKRPVLVPGGLRATIGVGEPLAAVGRAQRGVARAFILAGVLALAGALLGAYLIGSRVSRPLRRMAAVAAKVDAGDLAPRIHDVGADSEEVDVLADAFNRMLDRLTAAFASQREFVADASHELRTPLTVIRGQLEVLASQPNPSGEEVRRVERLVGAEIARINRLVDVLLLLAKTEQTQFLRPAPIDLQTFVSELWDGVSLTASRRFELGALARGTLRADPDRLAQALRNLLANAIAHTAPEHGLVRMRVEGAAGGRVRFIVEDDGPGIPIDQRERVFDRFYRTDGARDRASGGTGLGLAIVRAITEAHGGTVAAGESPEGGARIELELPGFAARSAAPSAVPSPAHPTAPLSRAL